MSHMHCIIGLHFVVIKINVSNTCTYTSNYMLVDKAYFVFTVYITSTIVISSVETLQGIFVYIREVNISEVQCIDLCDPNNSDHDLPHDIIFVHIVEGLGLRPKVAYPQSLAI